MGVRAVTMAELLANSPAPVPPGTPGGYRIQGSFVDGWQDEINVTWTANCVTTLTNCYIGLLGDGRILEGDD